MGRMGEHGWINANTEDTRGYDGIEDQPEGSAPTLDDLLAMRKVEQMREAAERDTRNRERWQGDADDFAERLRVYFGPALYAALAPTIEPAEDDYGRPRAAFLVFGERWTITKDVGSSDYVLLRSGSGSHRYISGGGFGFTWDRDLLDAFLERRAELDRGAPLLRYTPTGMGVAEDDAEPSD